MNNKFSSTFNSNSNPDDFEITALNIFRYQAENNKIYKKYLKNLNINTASVLNFKNIPFLPIEFFKYHKVISGNSSVNTVFTSSGTTGQIKSSHFISDISIYERSLKKCFSLFYGKITDYCILALLPSYLEQNNSSLVYMAEKIINESHNLNSGFFINEFDKLVQIILTNEKNNQKSILLGVSYALLLFSEQYPLKLKNTIVMETGGMKGRHKEITKKELHNILKERFKISQIHSEYGMTELLSQAYSKGNGQFFSPPWMKILIRDINDPFCYLENGKTGGINVIDFANINSCCFIETSDLGKINKNNSFEVSGRFDNSDIRGCNLMIGE